MKTLSSFALAVLSCAALLAGCGDSAKTYAPLAFSQVSAYGDGLMDVGNNGGKLYTVNSTNANVKVYALPQYIALDRGLTLTPSASGGLGFARGGATVADVAAQIDARLAAGAIKSDELLLVGVGMEDVRREVNAVASSNGGYTPAQAYAALRAQADALVAQLARLQAAGAKQIVVVPVLNVGNTPWAQRLNSSYANASVVAAEATRVFNNQLTVSGEASSLRRNGLLSLSAASRMENIVLSASNASSGLTNAKDPVCKAPADVDATQCTQDTLLAGASADNYVYADHVHPTPAALYSLASYVSSDIKTRWQ